MGRATVWDSLSAKKAKLIMQKIIWSCPTRRAMNIIMMVLWILLTHLPPVSEYSCSVACTGSGLRSIADHRHNRNSEWRCQDRWEWFDAESNSKHHLQNYERERKYLYSLLLSISTYEFEIEQIRSGWIEARLDLDKKYKSVGVALEGCHGNMQCTKFALTSSLIAITADTNVVINSLVPSNEIVW